MSNKHIEINITKTLNVTATVEAGTGKCGHCTNLRTAKELCVAFGELTKTTDGRFKRHVGCFSSFGSVSPSEMPHGSLCDMLGRTPDEVERMIHRGKGLPVVFWENNGRCSPKCPYLKPTKMNGDDLTWSDCTRFNLRILLNKI